MREMGIVTKIDGATATVSITMGEGCSNCNSKGECSVVGAKLEADLPAGSAIKLGDIVQIELPRGVQAAALAWIVLLPLALFGAGYAAGSALAPGQGEGLPALLGLGGIALGLLGAVFASKRGSLGRKPAITPLAAE
jgi:positive regulator of sigma E activity